MTYQAAGYHYGFLKTGTGTTVNKTYNYNTTNYYGGGSGCGCYANSLFGYSTYNSGYGYGYGCGCGCNNRGFGNFSFGDFFKFGLGMGLAGLATNLFTGGINWLMTGINTGNWHLNNGGFAGLGMGYGGGYGMGGYGYGGYGYGGYGDIYGNGLYASNNAGNNTSTVVGDLKDSVGTDGKVTNPTANEDVEKVESVEGGTVAPDDTASVVETQTDSGKISEATTIDDLEAIVYNNLSEDDKKAYVEHAKELLDESEVTGADLNEEINKFPEDVQKEIRAKYYIEGNVNATVNDLNGSITVVSAHDTSGNTGDITSHGENNLTISNDKTTITLETNNGTVVTYTRVTDTENKFGDEIIFKSDKGEQLYVLQKNSEGQYELVQYKYHEGYGTADVHDN